MTNWCGWYLPPCSEQQAVTRKDWRILVRSGGSHPECTAALDAERARLQLPPSRWQLVLRPGLYPTEQSGGPARNHGEKERPREKAPRPPEDGLTPSARRMLAGMTLGAWYGVEALARLLDPFRSKDTLRRSAALTGAWRLVKAGRCEVRGCGKKGSPREFRRKP